MKTATVRDLRNNFSKLEAWLSDGESVRIEKRGEPLALLTALPKKRIRGSRCRILRRGGKPSGATGYSTMRK